MEGQVPEGWGRERFSNAWVSPMGVLCVLLSQLTPASHNDLSDFRSEPALYF